MTLLLPLPLVQLLALTSGARGYTAPRCGRQRRAPGAGPAWGDVAHEAPGLTARASLLYTHSAAKARIALSAGLRDLVGPNDDDYYGNGAESSDAPYDYPSVRDERNSAFAGRDGGFGSGGYASGGNIGFGRRNSPGFVGFRGDQNYRNGNYPDYELIIDAPARGSGTRNERIFDNVDFDDLPGSSTRQINRNYSPYERGLNSDFIDFKGLRRITRGVGVGRNNFNDFDDPVGMLPENRSYGRGYGGSDGGVPQVYRRDYLDMLDGRSFNSLAAVEKYFEAWNRRNIPLALSCFDDDVYYDDTQFSEPFEGKDKLADHLLYVADCLPDSFYFVVDEMSVGRVTGSRRRGRIATPTFQLGRSRAAQFEGRGRPFSTVSLGALWHIENEFGPLPYARGCSFFKVDPGTNLIVEVYEFPEPAVIKMGSTGLRLLSVVSKLVREPARWLPFFAWITYVYVLFFSNGILPGKDILHAGPKTWHEVSDLSFNFMFIAPATHMPTAAKLNPVLEGIFNGLLAWSFMFTGFLSDERSGMGPYGKDSRYYERMVRNQEQVLDNGIVLVPPVSITKKNLIGLVPTIVCMQFFMVGSLLPYIFSRTSERYSSEIQLFDERDRRMALPRRIRSLYREELDRPALVLGEWRGLGILLAAVGFFALWWGFAGRPEDFGPPIWVSDKRMVDFMKILDKDRIAAGFVVDLWMYGIFQGWLVDDDWKRRGRSLEEEKFLRSVAKFVPFFGLASYLVFRPRYPSSKNGYDNDRFFSARESRRDRRRGGFSSGRG